MNLKIFAMILTILMTWNAHAATTCGSVQRKNKGTCSASGFCSKTTTEHISYCADKCGPSGRATCTCLTGAGGDCTSSTKKSCEGLNAGDECSWICSEPCVPTGKTGSDSKTKNTNSVIAE